MQQGDGLVDRGEPNAAELVGGQHAPIEEVVVDAAAVEQEPEGVALSDVVDAEHPSDVDGDTELLEHLAPAGVQRRLADLDLAAGKVPVVDVRRLDDHDPTVARTN